MAINTFTFGGITSSDYGIYVSGEGLFNAPKRDAEVVQIPGRDGDYILDKGSFENIEVTYRVFNQEKDLSDFRTKLANLRSALCSKTGYQRLTDTFHPNEYRMAAFIDGIEINPVKYNTASEFEIKFNCKPQRFLTSGETAVSVASGGKVTNPTLFPSRPQLQIWGTGDINIGSETITVSGTPIGEILIYNSGKFNGYFTHLLIDPTYLNTGDTITFDQWDACKYTIPVKTANAGVGYITNISGSSTLDGGNEYKATGNTTAMLRATLYPVNLVFVYGTAKTVTVTATFTITTVNAGSVTVTIDFYITYDGNNDFLIEGDVTYPAEIVAGASNPLGTINWPDITADSTKNASPMYIDLDIGECYKLSNGSMVSVNDAVSLPPELPTLPPGETTITYDNTITLLKVLPRWWKV